MAKPKHVPSRWSDGSTPVEDLAPTDRLAHEIVSGHRDLAPSVVRIMDSELDDDARLVALTSFNDSLTNPGDPNRDPRVAIANATAVSR